MGHQAQVVAHQQIFGGRVTPMKILKSLPFPGRGEGTGKTAGFQMKGQVEHMAEQGG